MVVKVTFKEIYHNLLMLDNELYARWINRFKPMFPDASKLKTQAQASTYLTSGGDKALVRAMFEDPPKYRKKFRPTELTDARDHEYTQEFMKEVAAQLLGYLPSNAWGVLTQELAEPDDALDYERYMMGKEPHSEEVTEHVEEVAGRVLDALAKGSCIHKDRIRM